METAGPGTIYIWMARTVSVQMPLILHHVRHELKAPRLRTWDEVFLVGWGRDSVQRSAVFWAEDDSMASLKGVSTTHSFLHFIISFPRIFMRGTLDSFCACSRSPFPGHTPQVEVTGFLWFVVTSTSALLAPLGHGKEAYVNWSEQLSFWLLDLQWGYNHINIFEGGPVVCGEWYDYIEKRTSLWWCLCSWSKGGVKQLRIKSVLLMMRWLYLSF